MNYILMKCLGLLFGFALLFSLESAEAVAKPNDEKNGIRTDHAAHFGISAAAQTGCSALGKLITNSKMGSGIACFLAVNTAGVIKEATDPYRGGQRDKTDIYANLAGSGLSFLTLSIAF